MQAVHVPQEHANDDSVLLREWLVADGAFVEAGRPIAILETSKATFEMESPASGYIRFHRSKATEVAVGEVLYYISQDADSGLPASAAQVETVISSREQPKSGAPARFSRKAAALLAEHSLREEQFRGAGLVRDVDVLRFVGKDVSVAQPAMNGTVEAPKAKADKASTIASRLEELPRRKRIEAKFLSAGQNSVSSRVSVTCATRGLAGASRQHPELAGSPLPLFIHEVARLLRKYPVLNATYEDGSVRYFDQVNVGIAVDGDMGLKVPIIRDADRKTLGEIRAAVEDSVASYLEDTLPPEALAGGTFTISDLSGSGVHYFAPLINQGQGAILGIGSEYFPPGGSEGIFNLMLTFDHRLTEGRAAGQFLGDLRLRIESYERVMKEADQETGEELCCSSCLRTIPELRKMNIRLLQEVRGERQASAICANCLLGF